MALPDSQQQSGVPEETAELLLTLRDVQPVVPDELTRYCLHCAGEHGQEDEVVRLISLAGEKFLSSVILETLQITKRKLLAMPAAQKKALGYGTGKPGDKGRLVLTAEDLAEALKEYGINAKQPPYYVHHHNR